MPDKKQNVLKVKVFLQSSALSFNMDEGDDNEAEEEEDVVAKKKRLGNVFEEKYPNKKW